MEEEDDEQDRGENCKHLRSVRGSPLLHPTHAALDRRIVLDAGAAGWYEGRLADWRAGRWGVLLEDAAQTWRLTGELKPGGSGSLDLAAMPQRE